MFKVILVACLFHPYLANSVLIDKNVVKDMISTDETETRFLLWTRENSGNDDEQELIYGNLTSLLASNYKAERATKIIVHGYTDHGKVGWVVNVKNKYLEKEDCNVISVDWDSLAGPAPWYAIAVENAKKVGIRTGEYVEFLQQNVAADLNSFHTVGFSLGGQLVSHIGYRLNGQMARITGLDPAGFLYHTAPDSDKLTPDDAQFVDVIHTAGLWIGTDEPVGHVDFYPNGGTGPQPGCEEDELGMDCSHARAPKFFAESITSEIGFDSVMCGSYEDFQAGLCGNLKHKWMGEPADISRPGIYFLSTNAHSPYAIPPNK